MAMTTCHECKHQVSTNASVCPSCGAPKPGSRPLSGKQALYWLGGIAAAALFVTCSALISSDPDTPPPPPIRSPSAEDARRSSESTFVAGALAADSIAPNDALRADELIHHYSFSLPHDSLHLRVVRTLLADARTALSPNSDGVGKIDEARRLLGQIQPPVAPAESTTRARLQRTIAHQDSIVRRLAERLAAQVMVEQRRQYASRLESNYLDRGMNVTVTARGREATTLHLKWILVSRVTAHQFSQNPELFQTLRGMGFKRFEITDGYDESWWWKLD